ncbi:MAG: phosphoribosyltransferase [Gemmatimonadales bacterium]
MVFLDRSDAGRRLAGALKQYRGTDTVVLALPRGGVPVGFEIAIALGLPLDIIVARKLGAPGHPEFAIGAIAQGVVYLSPHAAEWLGGMPDYVERRARAETLEMERREQAYRGDAPPTPVAGRTVILVDDGLATGATAIAAARAVRQGGPRRIVLAAPVCAQASIPVLKAEVDDLVCLEAPADFRAVGQFYLDFSPTTDGEVLRCLTAAAARSSDGVGRR